MAAPETARGTHVFKIAGYSLHKGLGVSRSIRSATFTVGGYDWSILYYPDGIGWSVYAGRVIVYLELMSKNAEVRALFDFRLVDQATGQATAIHCNATPVVVFSTIEQEIKSPDKAASYGTFSVKKSSELEASSYLRDDCLIIQCNVTVIKEPRVEPEFDVQAVPPSDLLVADDTNLLGCSITTTPKSSPLAPIAPPSALHHQTQTMAESQRSQTRTTASTCAPETARGTHVLKIVGYSLHKGLGAGNYIRSATFTVGGYDWSISYYPDGVRNSRFDARLVVYLQLMSKKAKVRALFDFRLVNQATGQATAIYCMATPVLLFNTIDAGNNRRASWGNNFSIKKLSELEASPYLRDDCLIIHCTVTVIKELWVEETAIRPEFEVQVPPSNLLDNLGKLLEGKRGADVTFKVKDELFPAHKIVLAMRSSVFDAEFYGPMAEDMTKRQYLTIQDMHPEVFRALLHFMYTDSIPSLEEFDDINSKEMVRQLLVAAD
ncbi:BTB/POZ and MATH domain-containing protein 2, partial [Dichanthelium oligosanthes]